MMVFVEGAARVMSNMSYQSSSWAKRMKKEKKKEAQWASEDKEKHLP